MMPKAPWEHVPPGGRQTVPLPVCRRADGSWLELSLLVTRGLSGGPVLFLMAGVHGDEFEGPAALWQVHQDLAGLQLAGTLVLLPAANLPAYEAGLRVNPADPKDLARTFPGAERGTVTEQIAFAVQHSLIAHADFLCDFHSAGRYYRIDPWCGYALVPDETLLARQREAARAVGYPLVWGTPLLPGRSLAAAFDCGIPALYVEAPGEGRAHPGDVARNVRAARQLLRLLHMLDEPLEPLEPKLCVEGQRPQQGHLQVQIVSRHAGFFEPQVRLGCPAAAGQPFGRILSAAGEVLENVPSPCSGRVVFLRTFPLVAPGDSLGTLLESG